MAKHNKNTELANTEPISAPGTDSSSPAVTPNFTLTYRREHPGDRCSYGITGVPGIVVFDKALFADPTNIPHTITLSVELALPRADKKTDKAAAKEARDAEKAAKAQEKADKAQAKANEKKAKAEEALRKAQERADQAKAKLAERANEQTAAPEVAETVQS